MKDDSPAVLSRQLQVGVLAMLLAVSTATVGPELQAVVRFLHPGPKLFSSSATLTADAWFARLVHEEDYLLAIRHAQRCLAADPESATCHRTLGIVLARSGRRKEALREYRQFLKHFGKEKDEVVNAIVAAEDWRFMN